MKRKKIKYKAEWKPFSLNKEYWIEVLQGRTIKKVEFDKKGIKALMLDNDERLYPITEVMGNQSGRFYIITD